MLGSVIERLCMSLNANQIYELENLCATGVAKESLMKRFDISGEQINMVQKAVEMKVKYLFLTVIYREIGTLN